MTCTIYILTPYFIYQPYLNDMVVQVNSKFSDCQKQWTEFLSGVKTQNKTQKWTIVRFENHEWAYHYIYIGNTCYGAIIDLNRIKENILHDVNFENCKVIISNDYSKSKDMIAFASCEDSEIVVSMELSDKDIFKSFSLWRKIEYIWVIMFLVVIPLIYWFLRRYIIKPLIENIRVLELENIEKELTKQKLMVNNLQLQIRPHFLLNMFNMIFTLAMKNEMNEIKNMIIYLSDYFRYIFRSGKDLEMMDKELSLIDGYIAASKLRYPGEVEYMSLIDPEIRMVRVPPLLVHNFIENAIVHAKQNEKVIHIVLAGEYKDGSVTLEISDDGVGMEESVVNAFNFEQYDGKTDRIHVGLKNSLMRLRFFYGDKAKITVESCIGQGTVFTIEFPYNLKENLEDEFIDTQ